MPRVLIGSISVTSRAPARIDGRIESKRRQSRVACVSNAIRSTTYRKSLLYTILEVIEFIILGFLFLRIPPVIYVSALATCQCKVFLWLEGGWTHAWRMRDACDAPGPHILLIITRITLKITPITSSFNSSKLTI